MNGNIWVINTSPGINLAHQSKAYVKVVRINTKEL